MRTALAPVLTRASRTTKPRQPALLRGFDVDTDCHTPLLGPVF